MAASIPSADVPAGLRYVNDAAPGIRRNGRRNFSYTAPGGRRVGAAALARIRALAIPPAWTDVWICPSADGHIQASGRDARGRKQYRYHACWRAARDGDKYHHLADFITALPRIRRAVASDLARAGLPREKVLAAVVRLLEATFIRVGNDEYARHNGSYGLTTLRDRHVRFNGGTLRMDFRGKSGREHHIELTDARLARILRRCRDLPGYELFQYLDESGKRHAVHSHDVNDYLRAAGGGDYTAKDFRTWGGTLLAACALHVCGPAPSAAAGRRSVAAAITTVAARLGNTPAVCRKSYVHPGVVDAFLDGRLARSGLQGLAALEGAADGRVLRRCEGAVLRLLRARRRKPRKSSNV